MLTPTSNYREFSDYVGRFNAGNSGPKYLVGTVKMYSYILMLFILLHVKTMSYVRIIFNRISTIETGNKYNQSLLEQLNDFNQC